MTKTVIIENTGATLYYYPELKIVHHQFHKFTTGNPFRETLLAGLDILKKYRAQKWLSDDRMNGVLNPADTEWALNVWSPQVIAAGWKYWALVLPEMVIGQLNMKVFAKEFSQRGIVVKIFSNPDDAFKWLEEIS